MERKEKPTGASGGQNDDAAICTCSAAEYTTNAEFMQVIVAKLDRGDAPDTGVVLGTLGDGRRCLAHTEAADAVFARLIDEDCVGVRGRVSAGEGVNRFCFEGD